jgi:AraC-like DNA-binding protein
VVVLDARLLVDTEAVTAAEVRCRHEGSGWSDPEPVGRFGMVLVRSGLFRRRVDGVEAVVDACAGYVQRPGSEQRIAHPAGDDVCTFVSLPETELDAVTEGVALSGDTPVLTTSGLDVGHRALVARARAGAPREELAERAVVLIGSVLAELAPRAAIAWPPGGRVARRVVDQVRQALTADASAGLADLARAAGLSTYHVSRVFRRTTGVTISEFRTRLRVRHALDRLAAGQIDLAALAVETGFADQSHLSRLMRRQTGRTPGELRALLQVRVSSHER